MKIRNIVFIGLGLHARHYHYKILCELQKELDIHIKLLIDLKDQENDIYEYLASLALKPEKILFLDTKNRMTEYICDEAKKALDDLANNREVDGVFISTEPKNHKAYALWAINHNLDVLVDKPITAPILIDKTESYKKIYNDYIELSTAIQKHPRSNVIVIAPRRYHKGYAFVHHYLEDFIKQYEIPITFIDIFHAEGQWNMPDEFFYRENHPYKYGYGGLLHSGYHFADLLCYFEKINNDLAGMPCEKIKLASVHTTPYDFLHQINQQAYRNIFNSDYEKFYQKSSLEQLKKFGEVDVNAICQFIRGDAVITTGVLNLLQTSFSRRMQSSLPKDTYKNNGRVREEHIIFQVGTLLSILIDSNQTGEKKDIGCNENFVIQFFRNAGLIGGQVYEKLEITDNTKDIKLYQEARKEIILDWLQGNHSTTNLLDHCETEYFITKLYESISNQNKSEASFIQYQIK